MKLVLLLGVALVLKLVSQYHASLPSKKSPVSNLSLIQETKRQCIDALLLTA